MATTSYKQNQNTYIAALSLPAKKYNQHLTFKKILFGVLLKFIDALFIKSNFEPNFREEILLLQKKAVTNYIFFAIFFILGSGPGIELGLLSLLGLLNWKFSIFTEPNITSHSSHHIHLTSGLIRRKCFLCNRPQYGHTCKRHLQCTQPSCNPSFSLEYPF